MIVSRGPGTFSVIKVKSHQDACRAATSELAWIIRGNDKADALAKRHLQVFVQNKPELHNRAKQYDQFVQHTLLCSHMLQEVSQLVFQTRKEMETGPDGGSRAAGDQQEVEAHVNYSLRDISLSDIPSSSTWDAKWLDVVAYFFSLLKWPEPEPMVSRPISMLELMLDCLIAFQIKPPVNMRLFTKRQALPAGVDVSQYDTQYGLFSRHEADLFPPVMLTDASYIWLRTFDFLHPVLALTPYPRASLYALGNFGFCNSSPSVPVRPHYYVAILYPNYWHRPLFLVSASLSILWLSHLPNRGLYPLRFLPTFNYVQNPTSRNNAGGELRTKVALSTFWGHFLEQASQETNSTTFTLLANFFGVAFGFAFAVGCVSSLRFLQ